MDPLLLLDGGLFLSFSSFGLEFSFALGLLLIDGASRHAENTMNYAFLGSGIEMAVGDAIQSLAV